MLKAVQLHAGCAQASDLQDCIVAQAKSRVYWQGEQIDTSGGEIFAEITWPDQKAFMAQLGK